MKIVIKHIELNFNRQGTLIQPSPFSTKIMNYFFIRIPMVHVVTQ